MELIWSSNPKRRRSGMSPVTSAQPRKSACRQMRQNGVESRYVGNRRVTDARALSCVKEANGIVRVEMEALLSMELANSPMFGFFSKVDSISKAVTIIGTQDIVFGEIDR